MMRSINRVGTEWRLNKVARKVEIYLWGLFVSFLLMGVLGPKTMLEPLTKSYLAINYLSYVWVLLLLREVFLNFNSLFRTSLSRNRMFNLYKPIMIVICYGLVIGFIYKGNIVGFHRTIVLDFMPMFSVTLGLLGGGCLALRKRLPRMIALQSILAVVYTLWVYLNYPVVISRLEFISPHYIAFALLVPCVFALTYVRYFKFKMQYIIIFSFAVFLFLIVSYQTRGGFLLYFILFPLLFFAIQMKLGIARFLRPKIILSILLVIAVSSFLLGNQLFREQVEFGITKLHIRLYGGAEVIDRRAGLRERIVREYAYSRGLEAKEFIEQAGLLTWFIGRGYGAGWESELFARKDWPMVHFGPLHLVLKGGLPLSILFLVIVFAAMRRSWKSIRLDPLAGACLALVFCRFMGFWQHGPVGHTYLTYIFWIVLGMALASGKAVSRCQGQRKPARIEE